jgi:hypothetical protein
MVVKYPITDNLITGVLNTPTIPLWKAIEQLKTN